MAIEATKIANDFIKNYLTRIVEIVHDEIKRTLIRLGEECVTKIRDRSGADSWFDQTGNLRSSIGYGYYEDGKKIIESSFNQILGGSEGVNAGRKMIDDLAHLYGKTFALVIVAGMNYADEVEARDNKDVLASTELWAKKEITSRLEQAKQNALSIISRL